MMETLQQSMLTFEAFIICGAIAGMVGTVIVLGAQCLINWRQHES